jgi:hypothetical protein
MWNAFIYLARARKQGEHIPLTEIIAYCAMKGIDDPEFVEIVREFDLALMELKNSEQTSNTTRKD